MTNIASTVASEKYLEIRILPVFRCKHAAAFSKMEFTVLTPANSQMTVSERCLGKEFSRRLLASVSFVNRTSSKVVASNSKTPLNNVDPSLGKFTIRSFVEGELEKFDSSEIYLLMIAFSEQISS